MTEEIQFEKALQRLEKIVKDLESGDIALEEALKKYEEGVRLSRACQVKLNEAEKKIEILSRDLQGNLSKAPFECSEEGEETTGRKRKSRPATDPLTTEDEDLLL